MLYFNQGKRQPLKEKEKMKLKKSIKILILGVFVVLLGFFGSLTYFKLNIQSIIVLVVLLGLFIASGTILVIDQEKKWGEVFK